MAGLSLCQCKAQAASQLRSGPEVSSAKGVLAPLHPFEYAARREPGERVSLPLFRHILELNPLDVEKKNAHVVATASGESLLVTNVEGGLPTPEFSTRTANSEQKEKVYQWLQLAEVKAGDLTPLGLFFKKDVNTVVAEGDLSYEPRDLWAARYPKSDGGDL